MRHTLQRLGIAPPPGEDVEEWSEENLGKLRVGCEVSTRIGWDNTAVRGAQTHEVCLNKSQAEGLFGKNLDKAKRLGCGTYACAWSSGRRAVKITSDPDDVRATQAAQGLRHTVKLHKAYQLTAAAESEAGTPTKVWGTVTEKLDEPTAEMQAWIWELPSSEAQKSFRDHYGTLEGNIGVRDPSYRLNDAARDAFDGVCEYAVQGYTDDEQRRCERFTREVADYVEKLGQRGINWFDMHPGNFGVTRRGVWKAIDLGASAGMDVMPDVDELRGLGRVLRGTTWPWMVGGGAVLAIAAAGWFASRR